MPKADSIISAEERAKIIRAELLLREKEMAEEEAKRKQVVANREDEMNKIEKVEVEKLVKIADIETRDHLLEAIRIMRHTDPVAPPAVPQRTEKQQKEFEAEQEMGRKMVARAEAEQERSRAIRAKVETDERARVGHMEAVYNPNPGANEVFPAVKATLGKPK